MLAFVECSDDRTRTVVVIIIIIFVYAVCVCVPTKNDVSIEVPGERARTSPPVGYKDI